MLPICVTKILKSSRNDSSVRASTLHEIHFHNHWNVVADFCLLPVLSHFNAADSLRPRLWQENIINVETTLFLVVEIVGRLLLFALAFGKEVMIGTHDFLFG